MLLLVRLSRFWGVLEFEVLAAGRVGLVDLVNLVGVLVALSIFEGAIVAVPCGVDGDQVDGSRDVMSPCSTETCYPCKVRETRRARATD